MKRFLNNMNMERWVIVVSAVVALALGGVGFVFRSERVALQDGLDLDVPRTAQESAQLAQRYSKLYTDADTKGLFGQNDPQSTIRDLATRPETGLGSVDIPPPAETSPRRGVKDIKYTIRPQDRNRAFPRLRIANFLFMLEDAAGRMRVTRIRMDVDPKNLKPWELPPGEPGQERWRWEVDVTSREKSGDTK